MRVLPAVLVLLAAAPCTAQWNPSAGSWLKSETTDVRIMTWNVKDAIASRRSKVEQTTQWEAVARIVASLQPDILLVQEAGDNPTGGVDSTGVLTQVFGLFLHGGNDPYLGGAVTAYVQKYAPGYDLPYIYVSTITDGYNRNVILSRFPFHDLNGDLRAVLPDIPQLTPHAYQNGGNGGIRGFMFAEIDLTDGIYAGDLVVGNAHLKAGGSSSDIAQRQRAAQNTAYFVDYWYQGAGLGRGPDPFNKIADSPPATSVLGPDTPVVLGGDWNEDEQQSSRRGPAAWLSGAQQSGSGDGTDRDRSDMVLDSASHWFTGARNTQSSSKLDYIARQDSIAGMRRQVVFDTSGTPISALPAPVRGFSSPSGTSGIASDHRPVLLDLVLPVVSCQEDLGYRGPGNATLAMCGGPLVSGTTVSLQLTNAPASRPGGILIGTSANPTPLWGGTLVPLPPAATLPFTTSVLGFYVVPNIRGGNGPTTLFLQAVVVDPTQSQSFAISNALRAVWGP